MDENKRPLSGQTISGTNYIRALGVVLVLAYHFFPSLLKGGFLGVDVFFTLSGYLITASVAQAFDRGRFELLPFVKRRVLRLLPAIVFMTLATLALSLLVSPDFRVGISGQLAAALTFSTNYYEISLGQSYENQLLPRLFVHTWSLAVEMQFYLAWGVAAAGIGVCVKKFRSKIQPYGKKILFWCAVMIGVFSYARMQSGLVASEDNSVIYYDALSHAYPIMIGAVTGLFFGFSPDKRRAAPSGKKSFGGFASRNRRRRRAARRLPRSVRYLLGGLAVVSLAGIITLAAALSFSDAAVYQYGMLSASGLSALVILCIRVRNEYALPVKEPGFIRFIGEASYSIYLLHWPVYIVITQWIRIYGYQWRMGVRQIAAGLLSLTVTLILARFSYRYVENMLREKKRDAAATKKSMFFKRATVMGTALLLIPSVFAVATAPAITSIEESFMYEAADADSTVQAFAVETAESAQARESTETLISTEMPTPTESTVPTEVPTPTETPVSTEVSTQAETPMSAEVSTPTEMSVSTEVSTQTETSVSTGAIAPIETPAPSEDVAPTEISLSTEAMARTETQSTETPAITETSSDPQRPEEVDEKYSDIKITDGILIIGDSVTLGASSALSPLFSYVADGAWHLDAKTSRSMDTGVKLVNEYKDDGRLSNYQYIVIALATNTHADTYDTADEIVESIGPEHQIIFVTGYGWDTIQAVAEYLRTFPEKYANVAIADWGENIAPYSNELSADGIHAGTAASRKIYAESILDAIIQTMDEHTAASAESGSE